MKPYCIERTSAQCIVVVVCLAALLGGCPASGGEVVVPLKAPAADFVQAQSAHDPHTAYERLMALDFPNLGPPGDPDLPCKQVCVILPPDADLSSVRVRVDGAVSVDVPGNHNIVPGRPRRTTDRPGEEFYGGKPILKGRNALTYGRDAFYPDAHVQLVHVGQMRQWKLAVVRHYPYRYNPVTRKLLKLSQGKMIASFRSLQSGRAVEVDRSAAAFDSMLRDMAENYESARLWYQPDPVPKPASEPAAMADYVIITRSYIVSGSSQLAAFVAAKQRWGYTVSVVTEADWGGGTGNTASNNIRNWLRNHYLSLGIQYVLLIGNPICECADNAPSTWGDVPMRATWAHWNENYDNNANCAAHGGPCPTDMFYSDLTGNWDLDGDGVMGDFRQPNPRYACQQAGNHDFGPGGVDAFPEVYVGRIPYYGSMADLDSILAKYVAFDPPGCGDWTKRAILAMNTLGTEHNEILVGEAIRSDLLQPNNIASVRIFDSWAGHPADITPCTIPNVLSAWQQGYGFVFMCAHGDATSVQDIMDTANVPSLNNNQPSFCYQGACNSGRPENSGNLAYSLLRHGAISTVGAARTAWWGDAGNYLQGQGYESMLYRYARSLILGWHCGGANAWVKTMSWPPADEYGWDNYSIYNLYGDPSATALPSLLCGQLYDAIMPSPPLYELSCNVVVPSGQTLTVWSSRRVTCPPWTSITAAAGPPTGTFSVDCSYYHEPSYLLSCGSAHTGVAVYDQKLKLINGGGIKLY